MTRSQTGNKQSIITSLNALFKNYGFQIFTNTINSIFKL